MVRKTNKKVVKATMPIAEGFIINFCLSIYNKMITEIEFLERLTTIKKASQLMRSSLFRAGGETRTLTPCGTRS